MSLLSFFLLADRIVADAEALLPIVAAVRSMQNPAVSNAGIANTVAAIQFAKPIVNQIEAVANVPGAAPMSGPEKLELFQATVQSLHDTATAAGVTTGAAGELIEAMPLLNAAVTAICSTSKAPGA